MKYAIEDTTLTAIGDAVREKTGSIELIPVNELADEIKGIIAKDIPEEGFLLTGDCDYMFYKGKWDWFIKEYGHKITTENITRGDYMFAQSKLEEIPFDIYTTGDYLGYMFYGSKIKKAPQIYWPKDDTYFYVNNLFNGSPYLKEIDYNYFNKIISDEAFENIYKYGQRSNLFRECRSLRKAPDLTKLINNNTNSSEGLYYNLFNGCWALDEIINLPVQESFGSFKIGSYITNGCYRIKNFTFATNTDGTPKIAQWKDQTINLTYSIGYFYSDYYAKEMMKYNSGITADKEVKDDATYQALKDDPDWYSCKINYSRYNRISAVNTINSLPDTSEYLLTNGGTNTISFNGISGINTDGGAINTLTEEEIAVATAKGWTVSLS